MRIIGTSFFKKWFLNSNNKLFKSFKSKILRKIDLLIKNKLSNWINIINNEFSELNAVHINQLKYSSFEKLLDWIKASEISNAFDSIFDLRNDRELVPVNFTFLGKILKGLYSIDIAHKSQIQY